MVVASWGACAAGLIGVQRLACSGELYAVYGYEDVVIFARVDIGEAELDGLEALAGTDCGGVGDGAEVELQRAAIEALHLTALSLDNEDGTRLPSLVGRLR